VRNVHCQDDKRCFRLSGLSQVSHDRIQPVAALGDPIAALHHVAVTAVLVGLCPVFLSGLRGETPRVAWGSAPTSSSEAAITK
jgi:hypothetical protein